MPTKNKRLTFMMTKEMEERFKRVKEKKEYKGRSDSEIIRHLIMMACVADETLAAKENPAS